MADIAVSALNRGFNFMFSNDDIICIIVLIVKYGGIMAYRLIAIDLDDTLLTCERKIHPRAKKSIRKAVESGKTVVLCTGRVIDGARKYYDELGLKTPLITAGGAEVTDSTGSLLFSRYVEPNLTQKLLKFAYDNNIHAQVYVNGKVVFRERNAHTDLYEKMYGWKGSIIPDILDREIITPKVLYSVSEENLPKVRNAAQKAFPTLTIRRSMRTYLEFSDPSVSKGNALKLVAELYGVSREETIAIGDTEIDIPMLEYAGLGVAVANADDEIKKAADMVCAYNEDGGVADVIDEFMLEEKDESTAQNRRTCKRA